MRDIYLGYYRCIIEALHRYFLTTLYVESLALLGESSFFVHIDRVFGVIKALIFMLCQPLITQSVVKQIIYITSSINPLSFLATTPY